MAIFCGALLDGSTPKVFGDGLQTRDYIFVGDVVSAFLAASNSDVSGAFNVGTGHEASVLDVGRAIASAYDLSFDPEMAAHRPGEVQRIAIDASRAAAELGWQPRTGLEEGLAATARWAEADRRGVCD